MKEWWEGLSDRERRLIGLGTGALIIILLYVGALDPLQRNVVSAFAERDAQLGLMHKLQQIAAEAESLKAQQVDSGALPEGMTLQAAVETSAQAAALGEELLSVTADDPHTVKVVIQEAPLDNVIMWLVTLRQQYGARVQLLEATRGSDPGMGQFAVTLSDR
jgi:general secretion pathway protein M